MNDSVTTVNATSITAVCVGFTILGLLFLMTGNLHRERRKQRLEKINAAHFDQIIVPSTSSIESRGKKLDDIYLRARRVRRNAERHQGWLNAQLDSMLEEPKK